MTKEIYVLATTVPSRANPSRKGWAYRIEYAPANVKTPFILSEKVGNDLMSGKFSAEHLLCDDWSNHIEHTKSEWLEWQRVKKWIKLRFYRHTNLTAANRQSERCNALFEP